ncbi:hypothetical protein Mal64_29100 [Pseudobythopirellula maris]|uniref:Uncharacterized protein n=1 Tax=Pseudobythopirellula maris TaxID=2527991 RepID=A0A5C5ZKP5_9BACT|nr:hypothetical protein [Pseudobythopirellula maris]TWT87371.1 hypothetical protein Mal64_29100 [Pseudobythopirellula maris]
MSDYRYVVFPPGKQPTLDEVASFQKFADRLERRFAFGRCRSSGGLVVACDAERFDALMGMDPAFDDLVTKWRVRGCELVDKLGFVKDASALKPLERATNLSVGPAAFKNTDKIPPAAARSERTQHEKEVSAAEAEGVTRLGAHRLAQRVDTVERAAHWLPYAMLALATVALLATGGYLGWRMTNGERESRADTLERVAADPMTEQLAPTHGARDAQETGEGDQSPSTPGSQSESAGQ